MNFAAENYGWTLEYITDQVSLLCLMLMMRQKMYDNGHKGITLEDKEVIDNANWSELIKRNREALYKQLKSN